MTCPDAHTHGSPFRYCACGWTERDDQPPRHLGTQHLLSLFESEHLPAHLQPISRICESTAQGIVSVLADGAELTAGLRKLLEAKDCFVRQAVIDNRDGDA